MQKKKILLIVVVLATVAVLSTVLLWPKPTPKFHLFNLQFNNTNLQTENSWVVKFDIQNLGDAKATNVTVLFTILCTVEDYRKPPVNGFLQSVNVTLTVWYELPLLESKEVRNGSIMRDDLPKFIGMTWNQLQTMAFEDCTDVQLATRLYLFDSHQNLVSYTISCAEGVKETYTF